MLLILNDVQDFLITARYSLAKMCLVWVSFVKHNIILLKSQLKVNSMRKVLSKDPVTWKHPLLVSSETYQRRCNSSSQQGLG